MRPFPPIRRRPGLAPLLLATAASLPVSAAPAQRCPAAAQALIDGLYRWHVASQNDAGPLLLISQRERFTPSLYSQLVRAAALTPADGGGFLDFDVFSGTQVGTRGATLRSCQAAGSGLEALVAVRVGLRGRPPEPARLLRYSLKTGPDGRWRIADITYPDNPSFQLSEHLRVLLRPRP